MATRVLIHDSARVLTVQTFDTSAEADTWCFGYTEGAREFGANVDAYDPEDEGVITEFVEGGATKDDGGTWKDYFDKLRAKILAERQGA